LTFCQACDTKVIANEVISLRRTTMNADSVRKLDARILELAKYEASKGGLRMPSRKRIGENFRYFKSLLMRKEATVDELDDMIRLRYGDPNRKTKSWEDLGIREARPEDLALMPSSEVISNELLPSMR
jgi:hypothetical protein